MSKAQLRHLKELESRADQLDTVLHKQALDAIARGAFYDELTEDEKSDFCAYMNTTRETLESLTDYLHFRIFKKPFCNYVITKLDLFSKGEFL